MNIFIDESGSFLPLQGQKPKVSCVAALVIPSNDVENISAEFTRIRSTWPLAGEEVKGSTLDEKQISEVIGLLRSYDVLLEIVAIDAGSHTDDDVRNHQASFSTRMVENLTSEHLPEVTEDIYARRDYMASMSRQLYVQSMLTIQLVSNVVHMSTRYYSLRRPEELSSFAWIVDAKDVNVTAAEEWWSLMMLPVMEAQSLENPLLTIKEGDYSHFSRFESILDELPERWKDLRRPGQIPRRVTDIKKVMQENFTFSSSEDSLGIQLVDIAASAFSRAMNQTLGRAGWQDLGELILRRKPHCVRWFYLASPNTEPRSNIQRNFHGHVMEIMDKTARSI
ncbi:MAG: DUF3800 domain-containing protein [Pyrinomonadaceae bacterium]